MTDTSNDIVVTGGEGAFLVDCEDLYRAAKVIGRVAEQTTDGLHSFDVIGLSETVLHLLPGVVDRSTLLPLLVMLEAKELALKSDITLSAGSTSAVAHNTLEAARNYDEVEMDERARFQSALQAAAMRAFLKTSELQRRVAGLLWEGKEGKDWSVNLTETKTREVVKPPTTMDDLLAHIEELGEAGAGMQIRVIETPNADGSRTWTVLIPGTEGSPQHGSSDASDWTSNTSLMAGERSASEVAVVQALEAAQKGSKDHSGDTVVLAGYSQGGMVAAKLASDPAFRKKNKVSHVLTAGSPIDSFHVPRSTKVLSLQRSGDGVHRLDVAEPKRRVNWTTVTKVSPRVKLQPLNAVPGGTIARPIAEAGIFAAQTPENHQLGNYRELARSAGVSDAHSVRRWRETLAPVVTPDAGGKVRQHDFTATRRYRERLPHVGEVK